MSERLTPRRLLEMGLGSEALRYRIGENECWSLEQLPAPGCFTTLPAFILDKLDPCRFGMALCEGFLRLCAESVGDAAELGSTWLTDYLAAMSHQEARAGFLSHLETFLQFGLAAPDRIPVIRSRLAALDNAALEEQAIRALCWEPVAQHAGGWPLYFGDDGGIFAGLTNSA